MNAGIVYCGGLEEPYRAGLQAGASIQWCRSVEEANTWIETNPPTELYILSAVIPGGSAFDIVPTIRKCCPGATIWLVTSQEINAHLVPEVDQVWTWLGDLGEFMKNALLVIEARKRSL